MPHPRREPGAATLSEAKCGGCQGVVPPVAVLSADASMLPGVTTLREPLHRSLGPRTANKLEEIFGLRTTGDLLRHYPRRYYTRGELTDLSALREGDHVTVLARVVTV